ncbi:hypothetical protein [Paractinoplanes rishiriensis]|uniref:Uncharacterized protein n=1 Tax=Paractinoplanes rishiriensis TaxID=1050105 RepID=A0A919K3W7_9ACTN|nr:hypothetical protein [Actinoplanes rishiriensis]GIE96161.1 hypothetical protein Ari01nite_36260 [Actinoplanes rishiriensis]
MVSKRLRKLSRPVALVVAVGSFVVIGSAVASAAIMLRGRGELVVEPLETAGLEVTGVRLSAPLSPGGRADFVFTVRNRGTIPAVADRVTALLPLREARPEGCTSKVAGPLLARSGMRLTGGQRVYLNPGDQQEVTVPDAVSLAASSKTGCGFRVTVEVQATQVPPREVPTTPPTVEPTTPVPPTTEPTVGPPTSPPSTTNPPPPTPTTTGDCDPVDPTCS